MTILSTTRVGGEKGGKYLRVKHESSSTKTEMTFGLFLPSVLDRSAEAAESAKVVPVLFWLSGLTCDDTNFAITAGSRAFDMAEKQNIAIVMPDTSPRGDDVPNVDSWYLGFGAGFYLNATKLPYATHYHMLSYVTIEIPSYLSAHFPGVDTSLKSITGHSMGGHGALTIAFRDPSSWTSVSAFAPICHPTSCARWKEAFEAYLEGGVADGREYDATEILAARNTPIVEYDEIIIEQGTADAVLELMAPEDLEAAAAKCGQNVVLNWREGFDHGDHFIAAFIESHVAFHAKRLYRKLHARNAA